MPVKRRVAKQRRQHAAPARAERLQAGELPALDTEDYNAYVDWLFFEEQVIGLPEPWSAEGMRLCAAARPACR